MMLFLLNHTHCYNKLLKTGSLLAMHGVLLLNMGYSQTSFIESFDDDSLDQGWMYDESNYELTEANEILRVEIGNVQADRTGKISYDLGAIDLSNHPYLSIKARASKYPVFLNVTFTDIHGTESNTYDDEYLVINPDLKPFFAKEEFITHYFNLSGKLSQLEPDKTNLDSTQISKVNIYLFNKYIEGQPSTLFFDQLVIGSEVILPEKGKTFDFNVTQPLDPWAPVKQGNYIFEIEDSVLRIDVHKNIGSPFRVKMDPLDLEENAFLSFKIKNEREIYFGIRLWDAKGAYSHDFQLKKVLEASEAFKHYRIDLSGYRKDFEPVNTQGIEIEFNTNASFSGTVYLDDLQIGTCAVHPETEPRSISVIQTGKGIIIDGEIDQGWDHAQFNPLVTNDVDIPEEDDLSARFKALWDAQHLYLLLDIQDDSEIISMEEERSDLVTLFFDIQNRDTEINGNFGTTEGYFQRYSAKMESESGLIVESNGITRQAVKTSKGLRMEYQIPWNAFSDTMAVGNGTVMGFEITINDVDDPVEKIVENSLVWSGKVPGVYYGPSVSSYYYGDLHFTAETLATNDIDFINEIQGSVLILVDNTYSDDLKEELIMLQTDLTGDGWHVIRYDIGRTMAVPEVKKIITHEYGRTDDLRALILLGHVAVPYSGNVGPDGHPDHRGAWPADVYYADMDGEWTDSIENQTTAVRPENRNVPGDGKFDCSIIPSEIELQVGRIDLSNLPEFADHDAALLKEYIGKNHDYRTGNSARDSKVYYFNAWNTVSGMLSLDTYDELHVGAPGEFLFAHEQNNYLVSYGLTWAQYTSAFGVGRTFDFANKPVNTVFTILSGSYFGDWDNENNLLRASLASRPSVLAGLWGTEWDLGNMFTGATIGEVYVDFHNRVMALNRHGSFYALMGDPTLCFNPVKQVSNLVTTMNQVGSLLEWTPSEDIVDGYNIYRTDTFSNRFVRINDTLVTDTCYLDLNNPGQDEIYMVRPVKYESNSLGDFYKLGTGLINKDLPDTGYEYPTQFQSKRISPGEIILFPNPTSGLLHVGFNDPFNEDITIQVYNLSGQIILNEHLINDQEILDLSDQLAGCYFIKLTGMGWYTVRKVLILNRMNQ